MHTIARVDFESGQAQVQLKMPNFKPSRDMRMLGMGTWKYCNDVVVCLYPLPVLYTYRYRELVYVVDLAEPSSWIVGPGFAAMKRKRNGGGDGQHGYPLSYQEGCNPAHFLSFSYFFNHRAQCCSFVRAYIPTI